MTKCYSELIQFPTYQERLDYLFIGQVVGDETFGLLRDVNRKFYNSRIWKQIRENVITRDLGYDLGIPGRKIQGNVLVHHIVPLAPRDILQHTEFAVDPEFMITVSHRTHQLIHYGGEQQPIFVERSKGDTRLWT